MSSEKQSKFSLWYNSPGVQRFTSAAYSLGAAIVIVGALFKIMHWNGAGLMLSIGMFTEAFLFALGVFDKPHKTYEWDKVFSFKGDGAVLTNAVTTSAAGNRGAAAPNIPASAVLAESEVESLTAGIKNLSATAQHLNAISSAAGPADAFVKNIESASAAAGKFASTQDALNQITGTLVQSYEALSKDMSSVAGSTQQYAGKVMDINKNLASLNAMYELQLKNIQSQAEAISEQAEAISQQGRYARTLNEHLLEITSENQQIKQSTKIALEEINKYKESSAQLAKQIAELNAVYGNMLNALS